MHPPTRIKMKIKSIFRHINTNIVQYRIFISRPILEKMKFFLHKFLNILLSLFSFIQITILCEINQVFNSEGLLKHASEFIL